MMMNRLFLANQFFLLKTLRPVRAVARVLARGVPIVLLIFAAQAMVGQTEVCDTLSHPPTTGPSEIDCSDVTIELHVGTGSGGAATASAAFPLTSVASGMNIMVTGTFTIDKNFTFLNCKVFFNQNAEMATSGTVDLVGINTVFTYCEEKAWKSIQIKANGAIRLQGCHVAGALDGLDFRKDYRAGQSMLTANRFSRNRYSIISLENGTTMFFTEFYLNEFYGTQTVPGTGVLPHSGVRLVGCKASIGTPVIYEDPFEHLAYVNHFIDLRFGIEAYTGSTSVYVTNCRFARMRPDLQNGTMTGCGINAIGVDLTVSGFFNPGSREVYGHCVFEDCSSAGIRAVQCKLDVRHAVFTGKQVYGISSRATGFRTQTIERCTFLVGAHPICKAGIFLERPNGSGFTYSTRINYNTLGVHGNQSVVSGIDIRCPVSSMDLMEIRANNLEMSGNNNFACFGVIVYGGQSDNIKIIGNTIEQLNETHMSFGIFLVNFEGRGHSVEENDSHGKAQCNYHLEKSRNVFYCENKSAGANHGFHFFGDNDNATWSLNDIGDHLRGLLINDIPVPTDPDDPPFSSGKISEQLRKGNLWESDGNKYVDKAALCDANPSHSIFYVENSSPEIKPTKISPTTGWFVLDPGETQYCVGVSRPISTFEDLLASGEPMAISETEEWEATRLLMETLLRHPGQLTGDTAMQAFYAQNLNTPAGLFAQINQTLAEGGYSSNPLWSSRASKEAQFEAAKLVLDSLNTRSDLSDLESSLYVPGDSMMPVVFAQMIALSDSIQIMEAVLSTVHDTVLNEALAALDTITTTENYEQAYMTLRVYQIKMALGFEPGDAGYDDLMDVANADEEDYGGAVRQARHYLSDCERYARIAPDEEEEEERPLSATLPASMPNISIAPNPASNSIFVTQDQIGYRNWEIISSVGAVTKSGLWPAGQKRYQIMLDGIAPGAYYFVARTDTGAASVRKLIVIR